MKVLASQRGSYLPCTDCEGRMSVGRALLLAILRIYKSWISPALPAACRYVPTCSEYAMEAVEEHGVLRGSWLALRRIARCHPFGGHGADPVPPRAVEQTHFCQQRQKWGTGPKW